MPFRNQHVRLASLSAVGIAMAVVLSLLTPLSLRFAHAHGRRTNAGVTGQVLMPNGKPTSGAALWLEAPGLHGIPLKNAVIDQRNKTFLPHLLIVTPGTDVQFPNNDTIFHNVFAHFEAQTFDLGMYPSGHSKHQVFPKAGIVSVLCNIHPQMNAFIVIADSPYRTISNKQGEFHLDDVPPGDYTIRAWQESGITASEKCQVTADGKLSVSLKLARH